MSGYNDTWRTAEEMELSFQGKLDQALAREQELRDEVAGLKLYLNTHDNSDGSQVGTDLEMINNLLHEFASSVSFDECWVPTPGYEPMPSYPGNIQASDNSSHKDLESRISSTFIKVMAVSDPRDQDSTPILFQYAIKAAIIHQIHEVLTQFCCGLDEAVDCRLRSVVEATLHREIQPVYGRWRAVLHESVRLDLIRAPDYKAYMDEIVETAAATAYECGCLIYWQHKSNSQFDRFHQTYQSDIRDIFEVVIKMHRRIREEVISKDYLPYTAQGTKFNPQLAEPADAATLRTTGDEVVGCTRLGMFLRSKQGREQTKIQETIWRKPHVVTVGMLKDMIPNSKMQTTHATETPSYPLPDYITHGQSGGRRSRPHTPPLHRGVDLLQGSGRRSTTPDRGNRLPQYPAPTNREPALNARTSRPGTPTYPNEKGHR